MRRTDWYWGLWVAVAMLGLTFIYNPSNGVGFVYLNQSDYNYVIIVDTNMNVLRYYKGVLTDEERLDTSFERWLQDKVAKGMPFKSLIQPYRNPNPKKQYEQKRYD